MNKTITVAMLLVVLCAMGLVLFLHTSSDKVADTASPANVPAASATPQTNSTAKLGGLMRVSPPKPSLAPPTAPSSTPGTPESAKATGSSGARTAPSPEAAPPASRPVTEAPAIKPPADTSPSSAPPAPVVIVEPSRKPMAASTPERPAVPDRQPADTSAPKTAVEAPRPQSAPLTTPQASPSLAPQTSPQTAPQTSSSPRTAPQAAPQAAPQTQTQPQPATSASLQPKSLDAPAGDRHELKGISLQVTGQKTAVVRIEADSAFACKTFGLNGPERLVIDLPGSWRGMKAPSVPKNGVVKAVRIGSQPGGPRIVLDLEQPLKNHTLKRNGNVVEILIQ